MKHGPFAKLFTTLVMTFMVFLVSCTGQSPADLKNKISNSEEKISTSCQGIKLDGELLTKNNIIKIFECGTWKNQYPAFYQAIKEIPEDNLNSLLRPYNEHLFLDSKKQGRLLDIISAHAKQGDLEHLGLFLNKALGEYSLLNQLDLILNTSNAVGINRSQILNVFSKDSKLNISAMKTLNDFLSLYQQDKNSWNKVFSSIDKETLVKHGRIILDDLSQLESDQFWISSSSLLSPTHEYGFKTWAQESSGAKDADSLLRLLMAHETIAQDSYDLMKILNKGLVCPNQGALGDFSIRSEHELITKMLGLARANRDEYQKIVVDGLAKLIAFKNFCQNSEIESSLGVFYRITDTIMNISEVERDYKFVQSIQRTFPKGDEFALLDILSSQGLNAVLNTFSSIHENGESLKFSQLSFELLYNLEIDNYEFVANLLSKISHPGPVQDWYKNWALMWKQLSVEEKENFIELLSIVFDESIDSSKVMSLVFNIVSEFPGLTVGVSDQFESEDFYDSLRTQIEIIARKEVRDDIRRFLSNDGLVAFLKVFTRDRSSDYQIPEVSKKRILALETLVESPIIMSARYEMDCYKQLQADYLNKRDYYTLVNTLPPVCLNSLRDQGLVGQIYLWMNGLQRDFKNELGKEFHTGTGIWSPGMLQFIFSAAVRADNYLGRKEGAGVKAWLPQIKSDLENEIVKERVDLILGLSKEISDKTSVIDLVLSEISKKSDKDLKRDGANFLKIIGSKALPYIKNNPTKIGCDSLKNNLGADPCLSPDELKKSVAKIFDIIKRKNENGDSVIQSLLGALHPDRGVLLPREGKKYEKHIITLDEIIRFSYDLSRPNTKKKFFYYDSNSEFKLEGTTIERLEVIIRDISFLNNFYGAYFKNEVAMAADYRKKLEKSQRLMNWLQRFSGPFRSLGVFPKETKWLLKNARESYPSLIEVSDVYTQFDGQDKNYANFIQSVLFVASKTSPLKTQDYGAFRKPDPDLVKNHNGEFITEITNVSGLRHLSAWVESRFGKDYKKILGSDDFKKVNNNLIRKVSPEQLEKAGAYLLESYAGEGKNLNLMINDFIDWLYVASPEDIHQFESLIAKLLILLSEEEIQGKDLVTAAEYLELFIKNYKTIKNNFPFELSFSEVVDLGNMMLDKGLVSKKSSSEIFHSVLDLLKKIPSDQRELLFHDSIVKSFSNLLLNFAKNDFEGKFDWSSVLTEMFFSEETRLSAVTTLLTEMLKYPERELTSADYIKFLSTSVVGQSRYELLVEEVFTTQRQKLEDFLETTFQALQ